MDCEAKQHTFFLHYCSHLNLMILRDMDSKCTNSRDSNKTTSNEFRISTLQTNINKAHTPTHYYHILLQEEMYIVYIISCTQFFFWT